MLIQHFSTVTDDIRQSNNGFTFRFVVYLWFGVFAALSSRHRQTGHGLTALCRVFRFLFGNPNGCRSFRNRPSAFWCSPILRVLRCILVAERQRSITSPNDRITGTPRQCA